LAAGGSLLTPRPAVAGRRRLPSEV
jgi:hypothetical protein